MGATPRDPDTTSPPLPPDAAALLRRLLGPGTPPRDVPAAEIAARLPPSRVVPHPLVADDPLDRLRHARGDSLHDWIVLRGGRPGIVPDAVARPTDANGVRALLDHAAATGCTLIPYGGGSSVVGGVTPARDDRPVLTVDLRDLSGLHHLDETSGLATFGAGTLGPVIETALRPRGWMLGHFPQSFEQSTLGGWVAARSAGQQSLGFGRIEALFAGGVLEAPAGRLELPTHPASAAGPDLRQLVLGSEGRFGILTDVVVRATPLPEEERFAAAVLPDWSAGRTALREIVQARIPLSMARLSDPLETTVTLALAGHPRSTRLLGAWLRLRGLRRTRSLLLMAMTGRTGIIRAAHREAWSILRRHGAVDPPGGIGRRWERSRFRSPDLRETLWQAGYGVDTLETAVDWTRLPTVVPAVLRALRTGLEHESEQVAAFAHLSHVYPSGSSFYVTYVFRLGLEPDQTLERWQRLKGAASRAILQHGGTISHQHGVGLDHLPYLAAEKGELGMAALEAVRATFDPERILHPGILLPDP